MNTTFEVQIPEDRAEYARQVSVAVFTEIDRLERLLSRFDPSSDISQINALLPGQSVRVNIEVYECLLIAAKVFADTGGAFDVTFRPGGNVPHNSAMELLVLGGGDAHGDRAAEFFAGVSAAATEFAGLDINLGGIGKGYALDRTCEILEDWGIASALLHGGTSSVLAIGAPPGEAGWRVGVGGDFASVCPFREVLLRDAALGSSGKEVQGEHIIDPRTGLHAAGHLAAWVRAETAAEADALSTAFMVMNEEEVRGYFADEPGIGALLVSGSETQLRATAMGKLLI